ncbi:DUF5685 family protein [Planomonospora venezuelensis]|uniref:Regulatory protein n=1 Tax=Planomonospora venezuelensis TaxID=1999 RepID=A0A841DEG2_PLAVE|nr:DUF5685 family protein [Planomonospora venezuelensis]MBB5966804.1 hypothetical protein [Planomonospora venezuelensis]GIN01692.1 hypothetical protein Pve01_33500 [Planomonospora venezuelensis]
MFGIVRPCRHGMCGGLFAAWMAHLCGLCLALRDEHGHAARLVTNYDGLLVSVLTEAQSPAASPRRRAAPCALRGFSGAEVVGARAEGVRLAAATSLILASGKIRDHIADRDGAYARRPVAAVAGRMAARWESSGARTAAAVGFDPGVLADAVERQTRLETEPGRTLLELTGPTEDAVAAAFAHTAVLAGKPHNAEPLTEAGRCFGRLAHLVDAVEDLEADRAAGAYNPLLATGTGLAEARRLCDDALLGLRLAVADLDLQERGLVKALLVKEVRRSVDRVFSQSSPAACARPAPGGTAQEAAAGPRGNGSPEAPPVDDPGTAAPRDPRLKPEPGCGPRLCFALGFMLCSCGLYRPPWDEDRYKSCGERLDCGGCDACGQCCDACSGCCDACSCCGEGCGCDCNC